MSVKDIEQAQADPLARVRQLLAIYGDEGAAAAAHLLCDRYDAASVAFRVVSPDLTCRDLTFGELRADSERLAMRLHELGVRAGDRIAVLMGKSRSYVVTVMAIWRLGAVLVPLFTAFAPPAVALRIRASRARAVICDADQRYKVEAGLAGDPLPLIITCGAPDAPGSTGLETLISEGASGFNSARIGGDGAIIQLYTSGTTGTPKGVVAPLRALAAFQTYAEFGLGLTSADVFWNAADPGWGYGLYFGILGTLTTGIGGLLLEGGFTPQLTFDVLQRFGVTNFAAAPTVYRSLRASGIEPSSDLKLRCASSAGEPLTQEVNGWARDALGVEVHDHYGLTEAGMVINNHHHPALKRQLKVGCMGRAMPGWSVSVLRNDADVPAAPGEVGRIALDAHSSPLAWFTGYADDPAKSAEKFSADGRWYITGDLGRMDEENDFYFSSRDDDVIIMAGYRIGPFEAETVILSHPGVAECAVVATPDEVRGEVIEAVVVLRPGFVGSDELTREIQDHVKRGYAAHAYPRRIHYAEALPKTPSGKIQRFLLRDQLRERASQPEND